MDVQIRCICPIEDKHDHDTITLRDKLDFVTATAIRKGLAFIESDDDEGGRAAELLARLTEGYLLFGIIGWTVVDEKGKRLPVSHAAIRERLLSDFAAAEDVADAADSLYSEAILLPLLARASKSSPPTPTKDSTYPLTAFPKKPRKPSRRSSTTSTPTDATETTSSSLVGVSSGSLSSESAA
jgi:hypothetical protein